MNIIKSNARKIYYFGLLILVVGLPLSKFLTGLSIFIIAGAWLVEGNLINKSKIFLSSKVAVLWSSVYILHLIGLLYTSDFNFAANDLRIKLPLLLLPLFIGSNGKMTKGQSFAIIKIFVLSVVISSLISTAALIGVLHKDISDVREISFLISHIRLALMVCLSVFCLIYLLKENPSNAITLLYYITILWLIIFLFLLQSFTGIVVIVCIASFYAGYNILKKRNTWLNILTALTLSAFFFWVFHVGFEFYSSISDVKAIPFQDLKKTTELGHTYTHDLSKRDIENGNFVYQNICIQELDSIWRNRSKMNIDALDKKGQPLRVTLIRFLSSKNYYKDASGVGKLSDAEITSIENGIANVNYQKIGGINDRIFQIAWELKNYFSGGDPTGHSVAMRIEYAKTALLIYKEHPIIGVGTGDIQNAFQKKYEEINSKLNEHWRLRAHNQFLTIAATFGTIGMLWFLVAMFFPFIKNHGRIPFLFLVFQGIVLLSMLNEDTLETQAGVTFYAFFNAFFWFNNYSNETRKNT